MLLLAALARPEIGVPLPRREGTVVLAFDISSSMTATDLTPTRMDAAKAAARTFVERQPPTVRIGVVAFGYSGLVTQQPTADRASVLAAIDRLPARRRHGAGRGLQTSLSAIAGKTVQLDAQGLADPAESSRRARTSATTGPPRSILLSDGENTANPTRSTAAELASTAGVQVYPIGLGIAEGTVLEIDGFQVATALDEPLLRQIASTTDGRYFAAADEQALAEVATTPSTWSGRSAASSSRSPACSPRWPGCSWSRDGLSLAWYGRVI